MNIVLVIATIIAALFLAALIYNWLLKIRSEYVAGKEVTSVRSQPICSCSETKMDINCLVHGLYREEAFPTGGFVEPKGNYPLPQPGETIFPLSDGRITALPQAGVCLFCDGFMEHAPDCPRFVLGELTREQVLRAQYDGDPLPPPPNIGGVGHRPYDGSNHVEAKDVAEEMKTILYFDSPDGSE